MMLSDKSLKASPEGDKNAFMQSLSKPVNVIKQQMVTSETRLNTSTGIDVAK
ncbi:MAG: hypothetical protein V2I33_15895 [Kangiellaceae bacterium]|nr:hypothetical protein [Kangiellaceae bacterium]